MAKLTDDEANMLKKLMAKREAPDAPAVGRSISVSIDLGDEAQVRRAQRLGLLDSDEAESNGAEAEGESEGDEKPKRRGYFDD